MLDRWPHISCVHITFGLLLTSCFVSTSTNSMKCLVNWIPPGPRVRLRKTQPYLPVTVTVGLGISRTTAACRWNPVYTHFIEFVLVETKHFVGSNVNVTLTRQTCSQRSSWAAGSERRAIELNFSTTYTKHVYLIGSRHRAAAFFLQVPRLCTDINPPATLFVKIRV